MLLPILGLAVGLVLLTVAADHFVIGAARLAARLRLSTVVIGAVVIGFGTSAPEMVVSGLAAAQGSLDIAVGNVIGSNIANLSLVLGLAALVVPIVVGSPTIRREAPLSLGATVLFAVLVQGGLTRIEAVVAGLALAAALAWMLLTSSDDDPELTDEVDEFLGDEAEVRTAREAVRTLLGLGFTLGAAQVLVLSATTVASRVGLEEGFVGLTIVAIGTSLPELATSLQAARKGETDLIVGNLLGSNIFNSLAVVAVAGLLGPGRLADPTLAGAAVVLMLTISVLATVFMATGRRVVRWEGLVLLIGYLAVVPALA
ncbi:MAG: calcium/sodium antiporter [Actinobacteria bacterium]|nr:calcium/sodium antiporter [Actinomycetota bacterium]